MPHELPNHLRLKILGNKVISGKSQNFIDLVVSPAPEIKPLSVLVKSTFSPKQSKLPLTFLANCLIMKW